MAKSKILLATFEQKRGQLQRPYELYCVPKKYRPTTQPPTIILTVVRFHPIIFGITIVE